MDTFSTSVIAFKGKDFVVVGTDSRNVNPCYGNVVSDDIVKIHWICDKVFGTGAGNGKMIRKVFKEAREFCRSNRQNTVKQVADSVRFLADQNAKTLPQDRLPADFVVFGYMGTCEMYTVLLKDKTKQPTTKRKAQVDYEYSVKQAEGAEGCMLGSGKRFMERYLTKNSHVNYPIKPSTSIEDAKELMKATVATSRFYDFSTDGNLRVISISGRGEVSCSSVKPIHPRPNNHFEQLWIEDEFRPFGMVVNPVTT